jgi:rfaE bifunctional protein kinase chain/domain
MQAQEILGKFSSQQVLVVGDVCLDEYVEGVVERLNPEAPVPILQAKSKRVMTGCGGNVAKNLASLGVRCGLVSVGGQDETAQELRRQAAEEGYDLSLVEDNSRPTIRKVRHLVGGQQLLRVDFEETHELSDEVEQELLMAVKEKFKASKIGALIISDYNKGVITKRVAQQLIGMAEEQGVWVAADVKPARAAYVEGVRLVTPNLREAHEYLGINYLEQKLKPEQVAEEIQKKLKCEVYVTLGAEGVYVLTKEKNKLVTQPHVIEVFDVSGAGDTAIAVLTLAVLAGADPEEAAKLLNAAGAVVVGKVGSVGVTQGEILQMLAS